MFRTRIRSAGKLAALAILVAVVAVLAAYLAIRGQRATAPIERPKLQGKVVAVFNNTRYAHEVGGRVRFVLTAGTDRTYEDGTHELEKVQLESRSADGSRVDVVSADRAKVSDTSDLDRLDAEFISNVLVQTAEGLTLKSSYLLYQHTKNTVETKEVVEFQSKSLSGRCVGMRMEVEAERVHLLKDVDVTFGSDLGTAETPPGEDRANGKARKRAAKQTGAAWPAQKREEPVRIRAGSAVLDKKARRVALAGGAVVAKGRHELYGSRMLGFLTETNKVERIQARGDCKIRRAEELEVSSTDMDFFLDEQQQLAQATATGGVYARSLEEPPLREARADRIEILFSNESAATRVESLVASGGSMVTLRPPPEESARTNPTERRITAGNIALSFQPDGKTLRSAEAAGNAVVTVTPVRAEGGADKSTAKAPQMTAAFYERGNRIRRLTASGGVSVEIEATVAEAHPPRITTSRSLVAVFSAESQELERIEQEGDFRYTEGDKNAMSDRAEYDGPQEFLRLRGRRPTAWDSKARTQADEIDYDRKKAEVHARGDVRTTYYSRESASDATPFKNSKSPIFVTAYRAEARDADGVAVFTGNARGWQDDNFVKADRIELHDKDKRMVATGHVESAIYTVERETAPGKREVVPGFASAEQLIYSDTERLVRYEVNVTARQGTDRVEAQVIEVFLEQDVNEVKRLEARGGVVLWQPGRRAAGDRIDYTAEDGRIVLVGKNARVDDDEKGAILGSQLTFYIRDDKISVENQYGTGRVRSTHRLTKGKERR